MKIWIKLLLGIILGILIAILLPSKQEVENLLKTISELFIHIGRYAIFPLVFFSLIIGTYELKLDKKIFRIYSKTFIYLSISTILLVFIGIITVFIFSPKIPIITVKVLPPNTPDFVETLFTIFPKNVLHVLTCNGNFLLPLTVLAFILGANLTFDRVITRPIVQLCDSLSRIFYHIISLIVELFWIALIAITVFSFYSLYMIDNFDIYRNLLLIIGLDIIIIVLGIYPLILYLIDRKTNPYKIIYGSLASGLTGLISGDQYLSLSMLIKHGKENLRIPRKMSSFVYPFFAIFGRAGTALVSSVSFFLILNSLLPTANIDLLKILYVFCFSFLISFALGSFPGLGAYVAITLLCYQFDNIWPTFGLLDHYKILEPIKFILVSFGAFLDVITSYILSYLIGKKEQMVKLRDTRDFI